MPTHSVTLVLIIVSNFNIKLLNDFAWSTKILSKRSNESKIRKSKFKTLSKKMILMVMDVNEWYVEERTHFFLCAKRTYMNSDKMKFTFGLLWSFIFVEDFDLKFDWDFFERKCIWLNLTFEKWCRKLCSFRWHRTFTTKQQLTEDYTCKLYARRTTCTTFYNKDNNAWLSLPRSGMVLVSKNNQRQLINFSLALNAVNIWFKYKILPYGPNFKLMDFKNFWTFVWHIGL